MSRHGTPVYTPAQGRYVFVTVEGYGCYKWRCNGDTAAQAKRRVREAAMREYGVPLKSVSVGSVFYVTR